MRGMCSMLRPLQRNNDFRVPSIMMYSEGERDAFRAAWTSILFMPHCLSLQIVHFVSLCICVPVRLVLFFLSFVENIHGCKTISTYTMHNYTMTLCCTSVAFLLCKSNCLFCFSGSHDCTSVFPHRKISFSFGTCLVLFYNQVSICTSSVKKKLFLVC